MDNFPTLTASVKLTDICLTLTHQDNVGEFFLKDGIIDVWQLDEWVSKLISKEADKLALRKKLLGQ